jgi:hypothetical protein
MSEVDSYREIVKNAGSIDSYTSARETIEAYHKLHDLGCEDLEDFLFEYARTGIDNKYLKFSFENHLISCDYCVERLTRYKLMFEVIDEYGEEAFAIVKAREFQEQPELKERLRKIAEKANNLISTLALPCTIYPYAAFSGIRHFEQAAQKDTYTIGEKIVISMTPPKDGYLTIIHFDENNVQLLFPHRKNDDLFIKAGTEKNIGIEAGKPIGKHYIKAICTSNQIIDPKSINFDRTADVASALEKLLGSLKELGSDEWITSWVEFEVTEG